MATVPRPKSGNDDQVSINLPPSWKEDAERLARAMSRPGMVITRADVLRMALRMGLDALDAEPKPKAPVEHPETKRRRGG
jgi:hypothetical protein